MCLISVPNSKKIHPTEDCFSWLIVIVLNQCLEEKCEENQAIFRNVYLANYVLTRFSSNLVCKVVYMEGTKYVNLIEISMVVIEI